MNPFYDNWVEITHKLDQMQAILFAAALSIYWLAGVVQHHRGQR